MPERDHEIPEFDRGRDSACLYTYQLRSKKFTRHADLEGFKVYSQVCPIYDKCINFYLVETTRGWTQNRIRANRVVMNLELKVIDACKDIYYVDYVYLHSQFRGRNLAFKFYHHLITKMKFNIISGSFQSHGGESIWRKLSNVKDVRVKLIDGSSFKSKSRKSAKFKVEANRWDVDIPQKELKNLVTCFKAIPVKPRKKRELPLAA